MEKFLQSKQSDASPSPNSTPKQTPEQPTPKLDINLVSPKKETLEPKIDPHLSKKKPLRSSIMWDHFTKIKGGDVDNPRCTCNYCGKDYACDSKKVGTSSLWGHLNNQCKKYPFKVIDKKQKILSFQANMTNGGNLLAVNFNKENYRKALAKILVMDELPFRFVEGEGFKQFVQALQPRFILPSKMTVAKDIYRLYLDERVKLKVELTKTSQRDGGERVLTVTVDNASANDVAVNIVKRRVNGWKGAVFDGEHMHLRCCAHIINLIISEGLKDMHESIAAIRNIVRYIRSSPPRLQKFKACVQKKKIDYNGLLVLDVPTRWNSTYFMLNVAVKFQNTFERYEEEDEKYLSYFSEEESGKRRIGPPYGNDWDNARVFVKFLKTFYEVTLKFSASNHITANGYYHEIVEIQTQLTDLAGCGDNLLSKFAASMKNKYDKYWGNVDNIKCLMFVAIVLDPRFKMRYIKCCFGTIYDSSMAAMLSHKVEITLSRLYSFYQAATAAPNDNEVVIDKSLPRITNPETRKMVNIFLIQHQENMSNEKCNELEKYLAEEIENPLVESFDILAWWKVNSTRYKILSLIARDVLAIPVSTVASESAFSTGGRILDYFRSSLSLKMVESLICTENWLKSSHEVLQLAQVLDEAQLYETVESECEEQGSTFETVKGGKESSKTLPMTLD